MLAIEAKVNQHFAMQRAAVDMFGSGLAPLLSRFVPQILLMEVSRARLIADTLDFLTMNSPADLKRPLQVTRFQTPLFGCLPFMNIGYGTS